MIDHVTTCQHGNYSVGYRWYGKGSWHVVVDVKDLGTGDDEISLIRYLPAIGLPNTIEMTGLNHIERTLNQFCAQQKYGGNRNILPYIHAVHAELSKLAEFIRRENSK